VKITRRGLLGAILGLIGAGVVRKGRCDGNSHESGCVAATAAPGLSEEQWKALLNGKDWGQTYVVIHSPDPDRWLLELDEKIKQKLRRA
jgi:hypothetical protein